jgi:hypothetical protein
VANGSTGIEVQGNSNTISGSVLSGNTADGVLLGGSSNSVQSNNRGGTTSAALLTVWARVLLLLPGGMDDDTRSVIGMNALLAQHPAEQLADGVFRWLAPSNLGNSSAA